VRVGAKTKSVSFLEKSKSKSIANDSAVKNLKVGSSTGGINMEEIAL